MNWRIMTIGALMLVVAAIAFTVLRLASDGGNAEEADPVATANERAFAASDAFLDRYVDPDGRVVRHDQGGEPVQSCTPSRSYAPSRLR
jgi:hypothetical protein